MTTSYALLRRSIFLSLLCLAFATADVRARTPDEKLKPEEIIAKHLTSIAAPELLASVTTRIVAGTARATFRQNGIQSIEGSAILASDGNKNLFSLFFKNPQYPFERLAFNGAKMTVAEITPGYRSTLGDFFLTRELPFRHGLIGGTLSSAWPLLNLNSKEVRLEGGNAKKVAGVEVYEVKYQPKKGSDLEIRLYFDKTTFQHLRTTYEQTIGARQATSDTGSARQLESKYLVTEDFSGYKAESGLMLPHNYKLELSITGTRGTLVSTWDCAFARFAFNQKIRPDDFNANSLPAQ